MSIWCANHSHSSPDIPRCPQCEIDALQARVAELEAEADMTRKGDRWWSPLRLRDCRQDERIKVLNMTYQVLVGHMGTAAAEEAIARINKLTSAE